MSHEPWCPHKQADHSDPVKRLTDTYNIHRIGSPHDSISKWIAVALQDGASDGVLYPDKRTAVFHQHHNEQWYVFIKIVPSTMKQCEAEVMLTTARRLYDKGLRMADPDAKSGGHSVIKRSSIEDELAQLSRLYLPKGYKQ